jgi:copper chaperone
MIELQVGGMSCQHCVKAVTQAVHEVDPNAMINIDLPSGRVAIDSPRESGEQDGEQNGDQKKIAAMIAAIVEAGYEVKA